MRCGWRPAVSTTAPAPPPPWRRRLSRLRTFVASALLALILLGLLGQLVRDRTLWLGWLFFLPLAPLSAVALVFDLACRGRALPWKRFVLTLASAPVLLLGVWLGCGTGAGLE